MVTSEWPASRFAGDARPGAVPGPRWWRRGVDCDPRYAVQTRLAPRSRRLHFPAALGPPCVTGAPEADQRRPLLYVTYLRASARRGAPSRPRSPLLGLLGPRGRAAPGPLTLAGISELGWFAGLLIGGGRARTWARRPGQRLAEMRRPGPQGAPPLPRRRVEEDPEAPGPRVHGLWPRGEAPEAPQRPR